MTFVPTSKIRTSRASGYRMLLILACSQEVRDENLEIRLLDSRQP
jgi:hypothetical protein